MRRTASKILFLLALISFISVPLSAQTVTGTMQGTISDRSGGALPGVTVTIRNVQTGLERVLVTNQTGFFNAPFLPVGRYNVTAELAGFGTMKHNNVGVDLNTTTVQDFVLDPAGVAETITVSAEAPRVNVTDGEVKQTMRSQEIMSLPSPEQGSFLRLASVFSGYQENPTSGQDNPTLSSGSSVNFNGAGTRGTTFQINGVNNDDASENQHRQGVALATIQSFQVLTNSYSAEFGRGYGAVVLVQTKSGTNDLTGEVYGYFQDAKYNELDVFNKGRTKPDRYRRNYGFTAGFPLMQDRLFGFVNADMVNYKGTGYATRGVFTAEDLAAPRLTEGNDTPENRAFIESILARWPKVTPNAPNIASRAYTYLQGIDWPDRDYSARLDYNLNSSNNITTRYQKSTQKRHTDEIIIGENAIQDNRQSNLGLTWTGVLSSDTVQEARYGLGLRSTNVNIEAGNDTPIVRIYNTGVPTFTILGNAGAYPINRNQRDQQFVYNISTARWNNHTLKGGLDIRMSQLNDRADNYSRPYYTFYASCGGKNYGTGVGALLAGCVNSYVKSWGPFYLENSIDEQNAYAQDDWRMLEGLTFNLGVRYERVGAPKEKNDLINYYYKTTDYVDPRLGFAYTPNWDSNRLLRAVTGGQGRFSIRGGYGHYHGRVFQSVFSQGGANVRFNPPNAQNIWATSFPAPWNQYNISDPLMGYQFVSGTYPTSRYSLTLIDPELKMPETRQWNLTFERQLFSQSRLRISYIGALGKNLLQYGYQNLPVRPDDPNSKYHVAADWYCAGTGYVAGINVNATCPNKVPIADDEISIRVPRTNDRRPDSRYTTNLVVENLASSDYNAVQAEWETGLVHGFQGRVTYTYGEANDTGSEATSMGTGDINIFPPLEDYKRGYSRFDTRHRATMTGAYELPFLKDRTDWIGTAFGGWQVSTVMRWSTGTPFTVVDSGGIDFDFDGVSNYRPICVDPKNCGWTVQTVADPATSQAELVKAGFRRVQYGDDPNNFVKRNSFRSDGQKSVDFGLYKSFRVARGIDSVLVRLDVFNVFDQERYWYPDNDWASGNFGRITSINYTPRSYQLGVRLLY